MTGPAIYPLALMILFILIGSVFFLVNRDMEVETRSSMKTNGKETMKTMKTYKFRQKNTCKLGQWMVSAIIHSQQRKLGYPHQRESRSMLCIRGSGEPLIYILAKAFLQDVPSKRACMIS